MGYHILSKMAIEYNVFLFGDWYIWCHMMVVLLDVEDHRIFQSWQKCEFAYVFRSD